MRNLSTFPKEYVIRKYDLKGSTYDRQTFKYNNKNMQSENMKKLYTLKDLDFA